MKRDLSPRYYNNFLNYYKRFCYNKDIFTYYPLCFGEILDLKHDKNKVNFVRKPLSSYNGNGDFNYVIKTIMNKYKINSYSEYERLFIELNDEFYMVDINSLFKTPPFLTCSYPFWKKYFNRINHFIP